MLRTRLPEKPRLRRAIGLAKEGDHSDLSAAEKALGELDPAASNPYFSSRGETPWMFGRP